MKVYQVILVRSGYAFAYRKYSKKFIIDEDYARVNKLGNVVYGI